MRMLFDNVLIKERKEETAGIVVAGENKKSHSRGEVISAGPGQGYGLPEFEECTVEEGNVVVFLKDAAYKVDINKTEYFIVRERDILGILADDEK
jgi:co-chaperonin GroES (HSP10)